jgi:hypothetical protein
VASNLAVCRALLQAHLPLPNPIYKNLGKMRDRMSLQHSWRRPATTFARVIPAC